MKKLEIKVVDNGPINWPKPAPTEKDWVIARLLVWASEQDGAKVANSYDIVRSTLYLAKQVGFLQLADMFKAIRDERKSK
jgi:hypothetical protein